MNQPTDAEIWEDELNTNVNAQKSRKAITENLRVGYHWLFRRSTGQPGIIALSYGLLAASLANLTDGIIYSDDGAWDYSKFPATTDEFLSWYFKPEYATSENDKVFSKQCLDQLKNEL